MPVGTTVQAGGPHNWYGVRSSVDIGPISPGIPLQVTAAAGGVAHVRDDQGYSRCWVVIDHPGGWQTHYYHLKGVPAGLNGSPVNAGDPIGWAGQPGQETCGRGTPNFRHVHFVLYRNGSPVPIDGTSMGGYTVHATSGNYCGYWTRDRDGVAVTPRGGCGAYPSLVNNQVVPNGDPLADGRFVRTANGNVFRIAGGAPIHVRSWAPFGGPQPYSDISYEQFGQLRGYPRDGTQLSRAGSGQVYVVVGGTPLAVSACRIGSTNFCDRVIPVDPGAIDGFDHLTRVPVDGTAITSAQDGTVWTFAGGAPLQAWSCQFGGVNLCANAVAVDREAVDRLDHMNPVPADGTRIKAADDATVYVVAGGAPIPTSSCRIAGQDFCSNVVTVHPRAIAARDHLTAQPNPGTRLTLVQSGRVVMYDNGRCVPAGDGLSVAIDETHSPCR